MDGMELICFQIISNCGSARSGYLEALKFAKRGDFREAEIKIAESNESFLEGHHAHAKLIQNEANGELKQINLLLVHAEDQLMSAEAIKLFAVELIELYQRIDRKNSSDA